MREAEPDANRLFGTQLYSHEELLSTASLPRMPIWENFQGMRLRASFERTMSDVLQNLHYISTCFMIKHHEVYRCRIPLVTPNMNFESPPSPKVILCIDDDAGGLLLRKAMLETQGYVVLIATSGPAGIVIIKQAFVDAVVVDYAMPQMDGGAVALEIRKLRSQIPIIMLSGHSSAEVPEHILALISRFVSKGSPPAEFLATLRELVAENSRAA